MSTLVFLSANEKDRCVAVPHLMNLALLAASACNPNHPRKARGLTPHSRHRRLSAGPVRPAGPVPFTCSIVGSPPARVRTVQDQDALWSQLTCRGSDDVESHTTLLLPTSRVGAQEGASIYHYESWIGSHVRSCEQGLSHTPPRRSPTPRRSALWARGGGVLELANGLLRVGGSGTWRCQAGAARPATARQAERWGRRRRWRQREGAKGQRWRWRGGASRTGSARAHLAGPIYAGAARPAANGRHREALQGLAL